MQYITISKPIASEGKEIKKERNQGRTEIVI